MVAHCGIRRNDAEVCRVAGHAVEPKSKTDRHHIGAYSSLSYFRECQVRAGRLPGISEGGNRTFAANHARALRFDDLAQQTFVGVGEPHDLPAEASDHVRNDLPLAACAPDEYASHPGADQLSHHA